MRIRLFTIPNMITLANLFCGCMAILALTTQGDFQKAFIFITAGAVFDFLDGFAARMLKSYSEVGKQLDSLADMVTFGVAPAMVLYTLYIKEGGIEWFDAGQYLTFIVALFSALRLAKFNIDDTQTEEFVGMPTPACTLLIASAGWIISRDGIQIHPAYILGTAIALSYLLISPIRMFSLKFKSFGFKENALRYVFAGCSLICILLLNVKAVPVIIIGYIVVSILRNLVRGKQKRP